MDKINTNKIECIIKRFKCITCIDVKFRYLKKGDEHKKGVNKLDENYQCVYMFFSEKYCLKVGYVDQGSPQRWNSHHYTTPRIDVEPKTEEIIHKGSTLTRSIMLDSNRNNKFQKSSHGDIDSLKKSFSELCSEKSKDTDIKKKTKELSKNFREFIENNTDRVELSIKKQDSTFAIKLLESIAIYILNPEYEGKNE